MGRYDHLMDDAEKAEAQRRRERQRVKDAVESLRRPPSHDEVNDMIREEEQQGEHEERG